MTHPILGRREANKARTRESIVEALKELLVEHPVHEITVDQLAATADISRRTFFNYYASIQSLVSEVIGSHTQEVVEGLGTLDPHASPLGQIRARIAEVGLPAGLLEWIALLSCHATRTNAGAAGLERPVWQEKSLWLQRELWSRLQGAGEDVDEVYVATLAATVMACFAVTEEAWVAGRPAGSPVDADSVTDFHRLLDRALGHAQHGWSTPQHS